MLPSAALLVLLSSPPSVAQPSSDLAQRLAEARADPGSADWPALRAAYAASSAYDPEVGSTPQDAAAAAALQRGNYKLAAALAGQATDHDWLDLRAHMLGMQACASNGEAAHAAAHKAAYTGLLHAVMASGTGASPETAFHVLAVSEAYVLLASAHMHVRDETILQQGGHTYDVVTARHVPDLKTATVYVDVDVPFARQVALAAAGK